MRGVVGLFVILGAGPLFLLAQQPAPALPPINPAAARLEQTITGLGGPGFCLAYHPVRDMLVAGCESGTLHAWNKDVLLSIRTGSGTAQVQSAHQGAVVALAWGGGPILASAGSDRKIHFWNMDEGKIAHSATIDAPIKALDMSGDGKTLASAGEDMAVQLWDTATRKPSAKLVGHKDWIICLAFSGDGKQLVSGDIDGSVILWDVPGAKKLKDLPTPPSPPPKETPSKFPALALAFSPDGKSLALGSADGNIQLINIADGKVVRAIPGHTSAVTGLAFHPSGNVLASCSKDRTVRLWNPANAQSFKVLEGHGAWVEGLAFIGQGTRLASVSADQTVRIWDLTEPAKK
ncbi:MAG: WD40 repeat domain-containing protein [Gemmataceae bacterium]|nr:WD40 repeat domain-containing protein [Gemmataceae bacterium]MCI0742947.1 WD40 repeat domain-containing protein [Gemmataceae bacterium]